MTEKIELIDHLRDKTKILYKRYNHLVDTTKNLMPAEPFTEDQTEHGATVREAEIYTTKHYMAAWKIYHNWKNYVRRRDFGEDGQS